MTNTRVKFVAVVSVTEGIIRDAEMKAVSPYYFWHVFSTKTLSSYISRFSNESTLPTCPKSATHSTTSIPNGQLTAKLSHEPLRLLAPMQMQKPLWIFRNCSLFFYCTSVTFRRKLPWLQQLCCHQIFGEKWALLWSRLFPSFNLLVVLNIPVSLNKLGHLVGRVASEQQVVSWLHCEREAHEQRRVYAHGYNIIWVPAFTIFSKKTHYQLSCWEKWWQDPFSNQQVPREANPNSQQGPRNAILSCERQRILFNVNL